MAIFFGHPRLIASSFPVGSFKNLVTSFCYNFFKQNDGSVRFRSSEIALRQGLSVEIGNVPDSKVLSLVQDIVILFFFFLCKTSDSIHVSIQFCVLYAQQQILLIRTN